jgi:DNA-nicking Smr family endonuclease
MKSRKPTFSFKSFEEIKLLLQVESISFPEVAPPIPGDSQEELNPDIEEKLFQEAMAGVAPISRDKRVPRGVPAALPVRANQESDSEPLLKLRDLVESGLGFQVSDTPEYIEGTLYQVHPDVARRLHRGDYSIQAYLDLHRFKVSDARETLEKFLKWAVHTGKTGVLVIHGRGLSSPASPILKQKVVEWLTRGPWRKWIVAYASARSCDGGAGATYVLLRRRPISKRLKRSRSPSRFS